MEPEQTPGAVLNEKEPSVWNTVTPLSQYLAMTLFIALPFIGGWIGYSFAPEKVVEVEKIFEIEVEKSNEDLANESSAVVDYINDKGFYQILTDDFKSSSYIAIGTSIYSLEGAEPSNGAKFTLVQIPEAYIYGGGQGGTNFKVADYDFGNFGKVELASTNESQVLYQSTVLEGLDFSTMTIDAENYNIRDEDSVYFLQSNCHQNFFIKGSMDDIGLFEPNC